MSDLEERLTALEATHAITRSSQMGLLKSLGEITTRLPAMESSCGGDAAAADVGMVDLTTRIDKLETLAENQVEAAERRISSLERQLNELNTIGRARLKAVEEGLGKLRNQVTPAVMMASTPSITLDSLERLLRVRSADACITPENVARIMELARDEIAVNGSANPSQ